MADNTLLYDHLIDIGRGLCAVGVLSLGASAGPGGLAIGITGVIVCESAAFAAKAIVSAEQAKKTAEKIDKATLNANGEPGSEYPPKHIQRRPFPY